MKKDFRNTLTSICRETAKKLDMLREGSRWVCEVTEVEVLRNGRKRYNFYIHDRNSGHEYEAEALIDNDQNAEWEVEKVAEN